MNFIDSSGIAVRVGNVAVESNGTCDLGRVRRGGTYTATVTVQNSGNKPLLLTGDPLVSITGDATTEAMFTVLEEPSGQIAVRGSTMFTLQFIPAGADVEREVQLLIENNSRTEQFSFALTAVVDGTSPTVLVLATVPQVSPSHLSTGVSTDKTVWVQFSEAVDPASVTASSFTLTRDGAPVPTGAEVSYNADTRKAYLDPVALLESSTAYHVLLTTVIADLAGNPMVLPYEWSFTTGTGVVDTEAPQVVSTSPTNNASGIALGSSISATFTESIDPSTVSTATFLVAGGTAVSGSVATAGATVTFTPDAPGLQSLTAYTARLTTGIRDEAGNALASAYDWTFTTEQGPDTTGPHVIGRYPASDATGVSTNVVVTAEFDELVDPTTLSTATFGVVAVEGDNPGTVTGGVSYNAYAKTAIFTPSSTLDDLARFRVTLTTGIEDTLGNPMSTNVVWFFNTGAASDTTPPTVLSTSPSDGSTDVLLYGNITATFSESMNPASLSSATFKVFHGASPVAGTVSYSEATKTATFDPGALLQETTVYTAQVLGGASGAKDAAGVPLAADAQWSFTTEAGTSNPVVVPATLSPGNGAVAVPVDTTIQVEFSKMMAPATVNAGTFLVARNAGGAVTALTIQYNEATRVATFTPDTSLEYSTDYRVECTSGMTDIGGNPLTAYSYLFTTATENLWGTMLWDVGTWGP